MATVDAGGVPGELVAARGGDDAPPRGAVLFAHGTGSDRHSARNAFVAERLSAAGWSSLLVDLPRDMMGSVERLETALAWLRAEQGIRVGLFGASTGAASALCVAARRPGDVVAVVSRGGRPDLVAPDALATVLAPTLFIAGARDAQVVALSQAARDAMPRAALEVVPGAGHLFEEPGALERVAELTVQWLAGLSG